MKRVLAVVILVIALAGGMMWYRHTARSRAARTWKPLQGGGAVRFHGVTLGPIHRFQEPGSSWTTRLRDAIRLRSAAPLQNPPPPAIIIDRSNSPLGTGLMIWLIFRKEFLTPLDAHIVLPDGRKLTAWGGDGGSGYTSYYHFVSPFNYIPARAKTLRYECKLNEQRFEFEFDNPAYRTDLPVWKSAPLPQTQQSSDLALTLRALNVEHLLGMSEFWRAYPLWTITKGGKPAEQWFQIDAEYEDPSGQALRDCGLLSEPVWKVRCSVSRTNNYPFRDDEIQWLGTSGPNAPPEQTARLFPIDPKAPPHGVVLAGVFGRGEYWYQDGAIVKTAPPHKNETTSYLVEDSQTKELHITVGKPAVVLRGSELFILRDSEDRPARMKPEGGVNYERVRTSMYDLPDTPIRIGAADLAEPGMGTFQFFIPAPAEPELNKPAPQR